MRRILAFGLAAALAFTAAACRPEPAHEADAAETSREKLLETAAQSGNDNASGSALRERLGAPEHVTQRFSSGSGIQTVEIDADVVIPDAAKIPVVEVTRDKLTQEMADQVVNALVRGQLLAYDQQAEHFYGSNRVQKHIAALDALIAGAGASKSAEWKANMQSERDYWAEVLANSTEDSAPIGSRLTHPSWSDGETGSGYVIHDSDSLQLVGMAQSEAGCETLSIRKGTDESVVICYVREPNECVSPGAQIGGYKNEEELILEEKVNRENPSGAIRLADVASIPSIQMTQEEALAIGDGLMQMLGVSNVSCVSADRCWGGSFDADASGIRGLPTAAYGVTNPFRCVWRLRYTRTFNGFFTTFDRTQCTPYIDPEDDKEVLPSADYERIEVYVDDTGIVGFRWASPQDVGSVALEDASVLSFDEMMKVFTGTFCVANQWTNPSAALVFRINKICLGYTRVREEGVYDTGLLVPAWDFYGEVVYDPDAETPEYRSMYDESMFTINAIDGSLIDRQQGY